ncbi:MAG: undecaprenyldiphospho-muramoylpentapeptide beta-N-acetylglucosaminyltransferase [Nitrospira sp.]|nr:undecaprenyldiphospho-muramoylpentapeptide beta-N-acetylglucosaminyltransferase [Nitrospira sp.]MBS0166575.1 undecaprenyldiphospho-muramoylpentapeptide beta-N-acetylglucosaminyltransferase [Nitrospira sp.]
MTIVVAAGGTGGHLYPAIALVREFLSRDPSTKILFVGTTRGIESRVLGHEGFELVLIAARPVMGKGLLDVLRAVLSVPVGIWESWRLLEQRQADLVIGVGGYTSPAVLVAAALRGIPRVILEPNAYPGLANKVVGPLAQRIFLAFESASMFFERQKVQVVGMPIRQEFLEQEQGSQKPIKRNGRHLLVFGGSQGAKAINSAVLEGLPLLNSRVPTLTITHQTGEGDYERVREGYRASGIAATVVPFLYDMPAVLRTADVVVARAGAMTIAELTACGKPAILIPLPTAIYDHQMKNARAMEAAGGAVVLPQADLTGVTLSERVDAIVSDPQRWERMHQGSLAMRRIDAGERIVGECYAMMGVTHDTNQSFRKAGG